MEKNIENTLISYFYFLHFFPLKTSYRVNQSVSRNIPEDDSFGQWPTQGPSVWGSQNVMFLKLLIYLYLQIPFLGWNILLLHSHMV